MERAEEYKYSEVKEESDILLSDEKTAVKCVARNSTADCSEYLKHVRAADAADEGSRGVWSYLVGWFGCRFIYVLASPHAIFIRTPRSSVNLTAGISPPRPLHAINLPACITSLRYRTKTSASLL